jgi:hypothetical protein
MLLRGCLLPGRLGRGLSTRLRTRFGTRGAPLSTLSAVAAAGKQ